MGNSRLLSPELVALQIRGNSRLFCLTSCNNFVGIKFGVGMPPILLVGGAGNLVVVQLGFWFISGGEICD